MEFPLKESKDYYKQETELAYSVQEIINSIELLATNTLTWDLLMDMLINNKTAPPKTRKKGALFNWAN